MFPVIAVEDGLRAGRLIGVHQDPFDRMIAAQALNDDIAVIGADGKLDEEHGLVRADAVFAGHAGEGGVDLGEGVGGAASGLRVELDEEIEAGLMVDVVGVEDWNED